MFLIHYTTYSILLSFIHMIMIMSMLIHHSVSDWFDSIDDDSKEIIDDAINCEYLSTLTVLSPVAYA